MPLSYRPEKDPVAILIASLFAIFILLGILNTNKNAPSSCHCVNLLMIKKDLATNVPMDNKTFDKWKKCKKYHTGYATAVLKCQKLKSKK
tara:strand:+ start:492 stop:761 length:270 start_codon:yes stop_codon:yes gene_type:complete